ncbi:MAG: hypothetical protein GY811_13050 [Myxococcales bacterium]|nr:hypothetical protein [Myxococcales bacterium]
MLDSITLVFSHSELKDVVGTDALKSVLSGQYSDLVADGTLHLQVVWNLLADQPDFVAGDALAPFSVLKTWESELGLEVALPQALSEYSATELIVQASHCPIPKALKARARARKTTAEMEANVPSPKRTSEPSSRKPAVEVALAAVAVLGLAYGGYSLYLTMGGPEFSTVQTADIDGDLPVAKAKQLGEELSLLILDDTWYDLPEMLRDESLRTTLTNMGAKKVTSIVVQDSSSAVRASAQWVGNPPAIVVRLR